MAKLGRYSANRIKIRELTADHTAAVAECGTMYVINPTADTTLTLPAPASAGAGWWCEVMIDEEDGGTVDKDVNITAADGSFFTGILTAADGGGASIGNGTSNDFIRFDEGAATSGEMVKIVCLGDRYVAHGGIVDATDSSFGDAALS
tara:strand:+ start:367 stop:810 length:444 start_codon:yes stop_codon:yes gene_type:complete